ncbi:helix-turn-helix domain-containing protein [Agriterribacter sp.]|uniref:AraC family transcriptional regulator n=1 Tax=Agriterribacter sp. TaxID=2821509 RepID=UPI002BAE6A7B|nr:helix-turn-helix domain-containing protein [Agriterribacter sp.]HTN08701.1 helix-turn-helix domain-containing protein [Agriterribacter sp.]
MTPNVQSITHSPLTWKEELPPDFPGVRLPGGKAYAATGRFGSVCIQLYQAGDFIFGYAVLSTKEHFVLKNKPYGKGLYLQIILDGDLVLETGDTKRKFTEGQWIVTKGIPETRTIPDKEKFTALFTAWYSADFYTDILRYFPKISRELAELPEGNMLVETPQYMEHATRELVEKILRCRYPKAWLAPYFRFRAGDLLFSYLVAISLYNPVNAPYTPEEKEKAYYAERLITKDISAHYLIPQLAKITGMNEYRFKMVFKMVFGKGPYEYLREKRLERAIELLDLGKSVKYTAIETGWRTEDLTHAYNARFGTTPGRKRKRK